MPIQLPGVFDKLALLGNPGVISAMQGLTNFRKQAMVDQADADAKAADAGVEVSTRFNDQHQPVHDIIGLPATDPGQELDHTTSTMNEGLRQNLEIYRKLNAKAAASGGTKSGFDEAFGRAFASGGHLIRALAAGASAPDEISPEAKNAAQYFESNIAPLVGTLASERQEKNTNTRLAQGDQRLADSESKGRAKDFNDFIRNNLTGDTASDLAAAQSQFSDLPKWQISRVASESQKYADKKEGADFDSFRKDPGLGAYPTAAAAIEAYGKPLSPARQKQFAADYGKASAQYQFLTGSEKQKLAQGAESLRIARINADNDTKKTQLLQRQIDEGSPDAAKNAAQYIIQNPDYAEKIDKKFVPAVSAALNDMGVNFPHKLPAPDQERLTTINAGRGLLDQMDSVMAETKAKTGRDLTGPVVGFAALKDGKLGAPVLSDAVLAGMNPAQKRVFISNAQKYNSLANQLLIQETKNASSRGAVPILNLLHSSTPGIEKGGAINEGTTAAVRAGFDNAAAAIQQSRFSGRAPKKAGSQSAAAAGNVITDPAAILSIFGKKK